LLGIVAVQLQVAMPCVVLPLLTSPTLTGPHVTVDPPPVGTAVKVTFAFLMSPG